MYKGKYFTAKEDVASLIELRRQIPEFGTGADEFDAMAFYAAAYDDEDVLSGCGRLYIDDDSHFRIDYLGVLPDRRSRFIGDLVARMLLYKAEQLNCAAIYITVPTAVVRFFARYGFVAEEGITGDFINMSVEGSSIRLEGSCSKGKTGGCSGNCAQCV